MSPWLHQLRVTLPDGLAELARRESQAAALHPLPDILGRHGATLVSQLAAFEAYVAEAERDGPERYPLYRWTKATVADGAMRAKHGPIFAIHLAGRDVYPAPAADALEAELRPLAGGAVIARLTRHDTDPAKAMPIPAQHR